MSDVFEMIDMNIQCCEMTINYDAGIVNAINQLALETINFKAENKFINSFQNMSKTLKLMKLYKRFTVLAAYKTLN